MSVFFFSAICYHPTQRSFVLCALPAGAFGIFCGLAWFFFDEAKHEAVTYIALISSNDLYNTSAVCFILFVMHYLGLQYKSPYLYKIFRILTAVYIISASLYQY